MGGGGGGKNLNLNVTDTIIFLPLTNVYGHLKLPQLGADTQITIAIKIKKGVAGGSVVINIAKDVSLRGQDYGQGKTSTQRADT